MEQLADGILWYVVFLFSTTCHEAAHAYAAMRLGDLTAYHGGQVTLHPLPHIKREPIGTVLVPLLSYFLGGWMIGWASAPYDPQWALRFPKRSALMALAGPAANLGIVLASVLMIHTGILAGIFIPPESIHFMQVIGAVQEGSSAQVATMLSVLFSLNLLLCVFNLLPLPPLDGSGVLPLMMSESLAARYMQFLLRGGLGFIGLIIAWRVFDVIFRPIHLFVINLLYPGTTYG